MSLDARAQANAAQLQASDPEVSAFVAASAGSGKTKLLTDRLLRLMLGSADPARIQCLTFTKAAAAEMAVRLQRTLGTWVTLPDEKLDKELVAIGIAPDADVRENARKLFATVLDLPGGMRIGTIHAFCQSLLRRFPLEARLSPHFRLVDEADATLALRESREDMLAEAHTVERREELQLLAGLATEARFGELVSTLRRDPERLARAVGMGRPALAAALRRALGVTGDDASVVAQGAAWSGDAAFADVLRTLAERGADKVAAKALRLLDWLALPADMRAENWAEWRGEFLRDDGVPRGTGALISPKLAKDRPDLVAALLAEQERIASVEDARRAIVVADISAALASLAGPVAGAYDERKQRAALLDYDDLILRSSRLLVDPGAAWVLYKLDGGLDHLLLDEVQDTAPAQWAIAGALTAEFFAGAGAREGRRTVFAVGDRKQSIYSFQGADPAQFDVWRGRFGREVGNAGEQWREVPLNVSFRSTPPVLALVDAVFANPLAAPGVVESAPLRHVSDRAGHAGRVELWPLAPAEPADPPAPWQVPAENLSAKGAAQRLAEALAGWIATQTDGSVQLESRGRALLPGDVLVLVRRRNAFQRALVRALKARGVPVAGLDRMVLTEQPAVADLLALVDTLLLPHDDLSLACVLTSPLGGLDQDSLLALAATRRGPLWEALRARAAERVEWQAAWDMLATLLARVDYAPPHALFAEALGPLGGRARLLARLGPEAAEPIDELLAAALTYGAAHPPSLQGFVQWLRQSGAEVKREAEGAGGLVRVMTVHGSKGLQAPLVILPDTTSMPPDDGPVSWADVPGGDGIQVPVWSPRKELRCTAADRLRDATARGRAEEHNRLLYVALTRAEDRLLVCGWEPHRAPAPECWYNLVRAGFPALGAIPAPFATWPGEQYVHAAPQTEAPKPDARGEAHEAAAAPPAWAGAAPDWRPDPPPQEPATPQPLAPSRPQDAGLGNVPEAASPLAARDAGGARFRRGQLVHELLQHLPALPEAEREAATKRFLARPGHGLAPGEADAVAAEVLAVLAHPELAPLFGPEGRAEVALTGLIAGSIVGGLVDRLAVLPDRVLIADYKTNRLPPETIAAVPKLYLRQMAAYRAVLAAIHPDRPVHCALVWTTGAQVMPLPPALLDRHAPGAGEAA